MFAPKERLDASAGKRRTDGVPTARRHRLPVGSRVHATSLADRMLPPGSGAAHSPIVSSPLALVDQVPPSASVGVPAPPPMPSASRAPRAAAAPPPPTASPPPAPAPAPAQAVTAAVFGTVNSTTTPATMGVRRIPPRVDTSVGLTLTGSGSVTVSVEGASAANGNVTVNGTAAAAVAASGAIRVRGTAQTAAGAAGHLRLCARFGSAIVGRSNYFTVCAIPTRVTVSQGALITGAERGVEAITSNNSDSGVVADLDQVQMSESVQYVGGTGAFAGITSGDNSHYLPANIAPHGTDHHGTPLALITGAAAIDSQQLFVFMDARSGVVDIPVTNSGFNIHRQVTATPAPAPATGSGGGSAAPPPAPALSIRTTKTAVAQTVNGISALAGSGGADSGAQAV